MKKFYSVYSANMDATLTFTSEKVAYDVKNFLNSVKNLIGGPIARKVNNNFAELRVLTKDGVKAITFDNFNEARATARFIEECFKNGSDNETQVHKI